MDQQDNNLKKRNRTKVQLIKIIEEIKLKPDLQLL